MRPLMFNGVPWEINLTLSTVTFGSLRKLLGRVAVAAHAEGGALGTDCVLAGVALVSVVSPNKANVATWPVAVPSRLLTWTRNAAMPHSLRSRLSGAV